MEEIKIHKIVCKYICGLVGDQEGGCLVEGHKFNFEDILTT
jgi:hypothetical protein